MLAVMQASLHRRIGASDFTLGRGNQHVREGPFHDISLAGTAAVSLRRGQLERAKLRRRSMYQVGKPRLRAELTIRWT